MPRFDDDVIDMRDLLRRLAEQFENAVMDAGPTSCAEAVPTAATATARGRLPPASAR